MSDICKKHKYNPVNVPQLIQDTGFCPCCNKQRDVYDPQKYNQPQYGDGTYCNYHGCNYKSIYNPNDHFHCCVFPK